MVQSLEWKPGDATKLINFHKHAEVAQEGMAQFKRGAQVVCKPGIFAFQSGVGEVRDVIDGAVIVYFDDIGATVYAPSELIAAKAYEATASAWLRENVPTDDLPLGTIVQLRGGVSGVVCDRSTYSRSRYLITWFDRHFWTVRRKWLDRAVFIVIDAQNQTALA